MTLPRILTIMGSGETAPTMVSTHRRLVARLPQPVRAVVVDTPFGFQENAPELSARTVEYFRRSVNIDITVAGLLRTHDTHVASDPVAVERGLRAIADSDYVFAGPGSPTYALRHWTGTPVARLVSDKLRDGGIVTFASAAALTLGRATVPVYEIYKVGQDVQRLDGLDVLSTIGINAAVVPHWDNAEGGNHDTRFCYLGEPRLELFERLLDDETYVLGIDEHTALSIDIDASMASVSGNGTVTIRLRDRSFTFQSGATIPLSALQDPTTIEKSNSMGVSAMSESPHGVGSGEQSAAERGRSTGSSPVEGGSLGGVVDSAARTFALALESRDAQTAVRVALELEHAMGAWAADPTQSDAMDRAHEALRSMISALGDAAVGGVTDPRQVVGPYVEAMLEVRAIVRAEKRFDLSDIIRDAFARLGVEVRDTPAGVEWLLGDPQP